MRQPMSVGLRIGLTGGIAAGKSTVSARMRELGVTVIDYDSLARAVVAPGTQGLQLIVDEFGDCAVGEDGMLDRAWMAEHVFGADAESGARERLDAIEHPLIYVEAGRLEQAAGDGAIVVHDVPLLAEVIDVMPFTFDHIVTVEAPEHVRVHRMMTTRGMTYEQAMGRIRHQSSRAERERIADTVIDSTQTIEQMFDCVDMLVSQWCAELLESGDTGTCRDGEPRTMA